MNIFNIKFRVSKRELKEGLFVRNSLYHHWPPGHISSIHIDSVWVKENENHLFLIPYDELEILDGVDADGKEVWISYYEYI